jgi:uncharacterized membrane protein YfcA
MIDITFVVIVFGCFIAAIVNAAFATGGVYIMLMASSSVLPVSHAIPLQTAFGFGSLSGRIFYFWRYINWRIFYTFVLGSLVGVLMGTRAFVSFPEELLSALLGVVLLIIIWAPSIKSIPSLKNPFLLVGVLHSFLGALFGVGGILQPIILRTQLRKFEITGTLAACMLTLDLFKAIAYLSIGFNYLVYTPHIIGAIVSGFIGTWIGRRMTHHVSEDVFRRVFRLLVSIVAIRFIFKGLF